MGSTEMNVNRAYDEYKYFLTKYLLLEMTKIDCIGRKGM